jgi:hypothetical protein
MQFLELTFNKMSLIQLHHLKNQLNLNFQKLSKWRIIQKNLVHFQGFPKELNNEEILASPQYFGQYGKITKICLVPIKDDRTYHSAYITFETEEQAAYCILAVDSIKIKNNLVRAFFGTTKYCNNFLKGYACFNKKCKFIHRYADNTKDIVINDIKFGYSEHINLAKKIIGFGSLKSFEYIKRNCDLSIKHVLPDIRNIYSIEHINDKNKNHRRKQSTSSNNSTNNSANNSSNDSINNSINEFLNEFMDDSFDKNLNLECEKKCEENKHEENKDLKEKEIPKSSIFDNKNVHKIVDGLLKRKSFFKNFEKYDFGKSLFRKYENEYCKKFLDKTMDEDIHQIIKYNF